MSGELIAALHEKMRHLEKMRTHLMYSYNKISAWWKVDADFSGWNEEQLESLAAFKGRFAEFQDHLASVMRLIANIEGEDTRQFTYVLNYMVKLYLLEGIQEWREVRDLRNAATHDYSEPEEVKAVHFHRLLQKTHYLNETMEKLLRFVSTAYPE